MVDDVDYNQLNKLNWFAVYDKKTKTWRAKRVCYCWLNKKRYVVQMARQIIDAPRSCNVDQRNHNTLDNQKKNLRICTVADNVRNRKMTMKKTSKHKGVHFLGRWNKWRARIGFNGKRIHLGYFFNEDDAGRAYDVAAKRYYGEFAYLNLPPIA